jgi:ribosomal protein L35AE/L33A
MPVEEREFKVSDKVTWRERRTCQTVNRNYFLEGRIVKILGPEAVDEEYNIKWLNGKLFGKHVFLYNVEPF